MTVAAKEMPIRTKLRRGKGIPCRLWGTILANLPIPRVHIIVYRKVKRETRVLLDCWALAGGRIIKNESLRETANRQLEEIGLHLTGGYRLVGVYPVNFKRRFDIIICLSLLV